jgi:hypothetical protein
MLNMNREANAYAHKKQIEFLQNTSAKVSTVMGQRASGKSGGLAYRFYQRAAEMPGGRFFLGAGTIDQLLKNVLPNLFQILDAEFGINLEEGEDYVVGIKPPEWFGRAIQKPKNYKNIISWSNGSWTELISPRKLQPFRGASTDGGDIDEALLWVWKLISGVLLPTFRGNKQKFASCQLHQTLGLYTSMPRKAEAMWLLSMEKKALADPKYFAYFFFSWRDNVDVIGEDYGERMGKTMDPIEKAIEIDGIINITTGEEYYHKFDYKRHTYIVSKGLINNTREQEYNQYAAIDLSFDFASHFNCMWVIQPSGLEIRCIDTLFVKFKNKLNVLVADFCDKYSQHKNKRVNLYGEPHGTNQREDNDPLFVQVQEQFKKNGWESVIWVEKYDKADRHKERYIDMNNVLEESEDKAWLPYIRFNADTCEDAIIAIQKTNVTLEHKKDKSDEKKYNDIAQEHAPHFTDALDYYRKQKFATWNFGSDGAGAAGTM